MRDRDLGGYLTRCAAASRLVTPDDRSGVRDDEFVWLSSAAGATFDVSVHRFVIEQPLLHCRR